MNLLRLAFVHYKRMNKQKAKVIYTIIMPLLVILGVHFAMGRGDSISKAVNVAFNIEDRGSYGKEMVKAIGEKKNVFINDYKNAKKLLEDNEVTAVYTIPALFTNDIMHGRKPIVDAVKVKNGNAFSNLEMRMEEYINKRLKENLLFSKGIIKNKKELYKKSVITKIEMKKESMDPKLYMTIMLIIYFVILSSNVIGGELQEQKRQKLLKRAITTANRGYEVIGGLYLGIFLTQLTANIAILFLTKIIIGYGLIHLPLIMLNICLAILFSISLGLFVTRIIENPTLSSLALTIISIGLFMLSTLGAYDGTVRDVPWVLKNIAKFTPQYWIFDSFDKVAIFPNAIIVLFMAMAMFTAGNFRLKNYINRG